MIGIAFIMEVSCGLGLSLLSSGVLKNPNKLAAVM